MPEISFFPIASILSNLCILPSRAHTRTVHAEFSRSHSLSVFWPISAARFAYKSRGTRCSWYKACAFSVALSHIIITIERLSKLLISPRSPWLLPVKSPRKVLRRPLRLHVPVAARRGTGEGRRATASTSTKCSNKFIPTLVFQAVLCQS